MSKQYRTERDSMGEVRVPVNALYRAQTQRAVENFPITGLPLGGHAHLVPVFGYLGLILVLITPAAFLTPDRILRCGHTAGSRA